jgi:hypothetical protein
MEKIEQPVQAWIATQSSTELDYIVKGASRTVRGGDLDLKLAGLQLFRKETRHFCNL